jgi:hypothetical protein
MAPIDSHCSDVRSTWCQTAIDHITRCLPMVRNSSFPPYFYFATQRRTISGPPSPNTSRTKAAPVRLGVPSGETSDFAGSIASVSIVTVSIVSIYGNLAMFMFLMITSQYCGCFSWVHNKSSCGSSKDLPSLRRCLRQISTSLMSVCIFASRI